MALEIAPRSHVHAVAKAICREECAYRGEPPCWQFKSDWDGEKYVSVWPNPHCNEPGCIALAWAALAALDVENNRTGDASAQRQLSP